MISCSLMDAPIPARLVHQNPSRLLWIGFNMVNGNAQYAGGCLPPLGFQIASRIFQIRINALKQGADAFPKCIFILFRSSHLMS